MVTKAYAGIGSRSTPAPIQQLMTRIARALWHDGYTLRSGGAQGADRAFANGAGTADIFLPWPMFAPCRFVGHNYLDRPTRAAEQIAAEFHPVWKSLGQGAKKLHARNTHQILGGNLDDPVKFVVCWTDPAKEGGTGQALRLARHRGIQIFNLNDPTTYNRLLAYACKSERGHDESATEI